MLIASLVAIKVQECSLDIYIVDTCAILYTGKHNWYFTWLRFNSASNGFDWANIKRLSTGDSPLLLKYRYAEVFQDGFSSSRPILWPYELQGRGRTSVLTPPVLCHLLSRILMVENTITWTRPGLYHSDWLHLSSLCPKGKVQSACKPCTPNWPIPLAKPIRTTYWQAWLVESNSISSTLRQPISRSCLTRSLPSLTPAVFKMQFYPHKKLAPDMEVDHLRNLKEARRNFFRFVLGSHAHSNKSPWLVCGSDVVTLCWQIWKLHITANTILHE